MSKEAIHIKIKIKMTDGDTNNQLIYISYTMFKTVDEAKQRNEDWG